MLRGHQNHRDPRLRLLTGWLAIFVLLCGTLTACESLLDVEAPSRVLAKDLENPQNAALIVAGAVADYECALSSYTGAFGLITDELADAALSQSQFDFDRRTFTAAGGTYASDGCGGFGVYIPVSTARYSADHALELLDKWTDAEVPDRTALAAKAAAFAGYSYVLLGEGFCTAAVDGGPELTPAELFAVAEERFTRAIETATDPAIKNLALVGRARARIDMGDGPGAVADAELVPDGFLYNAHYNDQSGRSRNVIYAQAFRGQNITVDEPYHDLTYEGVPDPRVDVVNTGNLGFDKTTIIWAPNKYSAPDSPIPIAKWQEAKLIIAEVEGGETAVNAINDLHAAAGIPAYEGGTDDEIRAQVIEERRREFFLEGQHAYDIIRFDLPLNPTVGAPYPKGGFYGDLRCLPLPDVERLNNPTLKP
jgi:hypothetical protein